MPKEVIHIEESLNTETLYNSVKQILQSARQTAYKAVNFAMVTAYWQIGKMITEDELKNKRAEYGKERELRKMCQFYRLFPIGDTLRPELSWSHYRRLLE